MTSPKPSFGYEVDPNFTPYNPTKREMDDLEIKVGQITGTQSNARLRRRLFRLITLYRAKIDLGDMAPRPNNVRKEFEVLRNHIAKVVQILAQESNGLSFHARRHLMEIIVNQNNGVGPLADLSEAGQSALELIDLALKDETLQPKGKKGRRTEEWRQITIEELARALDEELSVKPTKTKNGKFDQCLKAFMSTVACSIDGRRIRPRIPGDTYPLIAQAIDAYPTKPMNPLLKVEIWPGL